MSNLVNLVKALLSSKFNVPLFEAKYRLFEFDYQKSPFYVQNKENSSLFDE